MSIARARIDSRNADELAEAMSLVAPDVQIAGAGRGTFHGACELRRTPRAGLMRAVIGEAKVAQLPPRQFYSVMFVPEGQFETRDDGRQNTCSDGALHLLGNESAFDARSHTGSEALVVNLDAPLVDEHLAAWAEHDAAPDCSTSRILDMGPQATTCFVEHARFLWRALGVDSPAWQTPFALAEAEDLFANLLLEMWKGSSDDSRRTRRATARGIARAEAYLASHVTEPVSLAELARVAQVSPRTLSREFQARHGMSPIAFLHQRRLDTVHQALHHADAGETSVTDVAMRHGIRHLGRFAGDYRRRFGERPSQTLAGPSV